MAEDDKTKWPRVTPDEMHDFVERCLKSVGMKDEYARDLGDLIVAADYRGHYSHGLNRLDMYILEVNTGLTEKSGEGPKVLKETVATAWVDGNNVPGPTVGKFCMDLAIKKAKEAGVAWVTAKNSNHFGIAGFYSMMAAKEGLMIQCAKIHSKRTKTSTKTEGLAKGTPNVNLVPPTQMGMAFTNTSPLVVPTRATQPVLGTNPITVAAPGPDGDDFVLDMATSTVALGKVELAERKDASIPNGWGCDAQGKESHDPTAVLKGGGLLPVGGMEATGGYKGYGLMLMVEYFCSVLSGATMGPNVRSWKNFTKSADLGQCYVAIDPEAFAPGFVDRSGYLMSLLRNLEPAEGEEAVLVAGDPERIHMKLCDDLGGIPYHPNQIKFAHDIAKRLKIAEPKTA